jgi:ketosteroid isomerase-like protein
MPHQDPSIQRVLDTYATAVRAKDLAGFIRLYDPKVRVFDTWGRWSYDGATAWQQAVQSWFDALGAETVKVSFDDVATAGDAQLAVVSAIVTYAGLSAQGEPLRSMQNRLTWALRTSGHVRRIVHEHTSAPIGFDDMRAILQRSGA